MHLTTEQVERALHGEAMPADARLHLAGCQACQEAVADSREKEREVFALLDVLDGPVRTPSLREVQAAAQWRRRRTLLRPAAALLLAAGLAGAVYALPGSPLRSWIESRRKVPARREAPRPRPQAPPAPIDRSGVSIAPGRSMVVRFTDTQSAGEVRVTVADVVDIEVQAPLGAGRFAVGSEGLTIANAGTGASYDIRVPRGARHVEIRVGGVRVWQKEGARVSSPHRPGADGVVRIPLTR